MTTDETTRRSTRQRGGEGRSTGLTSRAEKLAALKEARKGGRGLLDTYEVQEDEVYDEVAEEEYTRLAREHAGDDDFVEEDGDAILGYGHSGYVDRGQDVWGINDQDDSEEEAAETGKPGKRKRDKPKEDKATKKGFTDFFQRNVQSSMASASRSAPAPRPVKKTKEDETDFMSNLLAGLDAPEPLIFESSSRTSMKGLSSVRSTRPLPPRTVTERVRPTPSASTAALSATHPPHPPVRAADPLTMYDDEVPGSDGINIPSHIEESSSRHDDWGEFDMSDDDFLLDGGTLTALAPAADRAHPSATPTADTPPMGKSTIFEDAPSTEYKSWRDVQAPPALAAPVPKSFASQVDATGPGGILKEDGSLLMYWMDAYERAGTIWMFGRIRDAGNWVSCCVTIHGALRNLYFLPRQPIYDEQGEEISPGASSLDVYTELRELLPRQGITEFDSKPVERRYAFEESDIPARASYLKVVYPFSSPVLSPSSRGATFERVFGTETNALELLLLKRRLMGPCWISLQRPEISSSSISWCKVEVSISCAKDQLRRLEDSEIGALPPMPPLTIASLSLRTIMDTQRRENEVVAAHLLVHEGVDIMDPNAIPSNGARYTVVRQLGSLPFPPGFDGALEQEERWLGGPSSRVEKVRTERALLSYLLTMLHRHDPDVVIGHNILGFDLEVLLHRAKACRVEQWSRVGRLRRTQFPASGAAMRGVASGRLMCDTYLAAKDLIKARSFGLTALSGQILGIEREEVAWDRVGQAWNGARSLSALLSHMACDAWINMGMAEKLQVLPLTRQLTTLAGNLWTRTLTGARAERNEYLLLHEFHRGRAVKGGGGGGEEAQVDKFILPDKQGWGDKGKGAGGKALGAKAMMSAGGEEDGEDVGEARTTGPARRKPAYEGGLVLEPKKGLYRGYVVALDFNSLYPSIIQEYNICFTTVVRNQGGKKKTSVTAGAAESEMTEEGSEGAEKEGEDAQDEEEDAVPEVPDPESEGGILPEVIRGLVGRRRAVKRMMKEAGVTAVEMSQLDIRQKALKLTANSMYGCLGFSHSRFYAKPLARLITLKGREILEATVALAEEQGLEVVYGDTDSIMVHMHSEGVEGVRRLAGELKREVNKRYKELEIEMDGLYKRMLLLRKKKYAALSVVNLTTCGEREPEVVELETKGLDMVRRDWCEMSRDVSARVLKEIMGTGVAEGEGGEGGEGGEEEGMAERIHEYLRRVGEEARKGLVPVEKYIITKSLTKAPQEYADARHQPHVLVAKRMIGKGQSAAAGETIPYLIIESEVAGSSVAERAVHPLEYRESQGAGGEGKRMTIDVGWYLQQQIHPPITRLGEPSAGTDVATIAECLGLDPGRYHQAGGGREGGGGGGGESVQPLSSQIPDSERFREVRRPVVRCLGCGEERALEGFLGMEGAGEGERGEAVPFSQCRKCRGPPPPLGSLAVQLRLAIQTELQRHAEGWWRCEEMGACGWRTRRRIGLGVRRVCGAEGCSGVMVQEYSDEALYTQLAYFDALFDVKRALEQERLEDIADLIRGVATRHQAEIAALSKMVQAYVNLNGRKYVDLTRLFSFCRV